MKLLNKYICAAMAMTALLTSCGDDDDNWAPGAAEAAGATTVYFTKTAVATELDPTDPMQMTVEVARVGATDQALDVTFDVIKNTADVYNVPTAHFAAGEDKTTVTLTFDRAEIGEEYDLLINVPEELRGKWYTEIDGGMSFSASAVRVKWNNIGKGQWLDGFWYGFWTETDVFQRDDMPNVYRIANPYTDELVTSYGETTASYTPYLVFTVSQNGYVSWSTPIHINTFNSSYGVEMLGWLPSALNASQADKDALSYAEYTDDDDIRYLTIDAYWYMNGVGGWGPDGSSPCYLAMPGVDLATELGWDAE